MVGSDEFVDALMAAPLGVALLARFDRGQDAVARLEAISYDEFLENLVFTAYVVVGPWISERDEVVASAFADAPSRRTLAEVISERFASDLHAPMDPRAQQWWRAEWAERPAEAIAYFGEEWTRHDLAKFYGAGQFSWGGIWTVSDMPERVENDMSGAWEMDADVISRWRLPVSPGARIFEVHRPGDWAGLTQRFPSEVRRETDDSARRLQRAPDWPRVAEEFDGVHLSWAGMLTADHVESDLGDGSIAWLRYWFTERTHWLRDVFGEPTPLPPPRVSEPGAIDAGANSERRLADLKVLFGRLGRG